MALSSGPNFKVNKTVQYVLYKTCMLNIESFQKLKVETTSD